MVARSLAGPLADQSRFTVTHCTGGEKRLYMFPPSFNCYPMPTIHPQTRVTRIDDIRNVDPSFHRFHSHQGMLAHMKPGDSLYVHGFSDIVLDHSSRVSRLCIALDLWGSPRAACRI